MLRLLVCSACLMLLLLTSGTTPAPAQDSTKPKPPSPTPKDQPIKGIGPTGKVVKLHSGFEKGPRRVGSWWWWTTPKAPKTFTEGPASDSKGNVYFSDIPNQKIYKSNTKGEIFLVRKDSNFANGLAVNASGEIIACEMAGRIVAIQPDGKKLTVLANEYHGKRFNAPNDLALDKAGGIYFTDPKFRAPQPLPQGKEAVYYITPERKVMRLIDNLPSPNGVRLSPDERTLYVIPSGQAQMMAYPIEAPGKLGKGRVFCTLETSFKEKTGGGDGAAVDVQGNLYIATTLGIQVFSPQGQRLGLIKIPERPSNVTFGGADFKTLYVTAQTSVYAVPMEAIGRVPAPPAK